MKTMKAAVVRGRWDIGMEEVERPSVGATDILVRVRACGICGSDLHFYAQGACPEVGIPGGSGRIVGHEYVGDVAEVGAKVRDVKEGDRIVTIGAFGAMAEYIKLGSDCAAIQHGLLFKVPPEISDEEAATIEPLCVSLCGVEMAAPVAGETAVVMGVGPVGLGVVECLKATTDLRVIAVGSRSETRLAAAKRLGADSAMKASEVDPYEEVVRLTGSVPVWGTSRPAADVGLVFECAGHAAGQRGPSAFQQGMWMLRQRGRMIVIAAFQEPLTLDLMPIVQKELKLLGSMFTSQALVERAIELVRSKKVNRHIMVSHRFPLEKVHEAFVVQADTKNSLKVIVTP